MISKNDEQKLIDILVQHDTHEQSPASENTEIHDIRRTLDKINRYAKGSSFPEIEQVEHVAGLKPKNRLPVQDYLPKTIGRFEIIKQIGIGGFGIVFHARDPELDREVALKILRPECMLIKANRLRFEREAHVAATLNHPAIVPVFETGVDGPIRFIVFGFVPGSNLAQWLSLEDRVLSSDVVATLVARLSDALACAHRHGILHRDLKPSNLLIENPSDRTMDAVELESRIRIADFGLAIDTANPSEITGTGAQLGTPVYSAPELLTEGGIASTSSDVYSLGIILYELLAGKPPFESESSFKLLRAIHENQPLRFHRVKGLRSTLKPRVPRDLEAICFKCLQKEPDRRYRSAVELHTDLQRFLNGQSVQARQVTWLSQTIRWSKRNPLVSGLLAVVAILLLVVSIGGFWANIELANRNENLSTSYFDSLVDQSQLARQSLLAGRKEVSLKAIQTAIGMLDESDSRALLRRNELMAVLSQNDLEVAKCIHVPHNITASELNRIAFDHQLDYVAYESDGFISVIDLDTEQLEKSIKLDGSFESLFFTQNQQLILLTRTAETENGESYLLQRWNFKTGSTGLLGRFENKIFAEPTDRGAIAVYGRNLRLLDPDTGKVLNEWTVDDRPIDGFKISPSQKWLAVWQGNQVQVWEFENPKLSKEPKHVFEHAFNPELKITAAAWSADESQLATCTSVHSTHLWSLEWGESKHREFSGHNGWVYQAILDPDSPHLMTSSSDGTSRVWNYQTGELLMICDGIAVSASENMDWIAGIQKGKILIWQQRSNEIETIWRSQSCECPLTANDGIANDSAQNILVTNSDQLLLLDGDSRKQKLAINQRSESDVVFSGDGRFAFWASQSQLQCLECNTGRQTVLLTRNDFFAIESNSLSASYDGKRIAFAISGTQFELDCESKELNSLAEEIVGIGFCRYHKTEPVIAMPQKDGISIENYESGKQLRLIKRKSQPLIFTPDGSGLLIRENQRLALVSLASGQVEDAIPISNNFSLDQFSFSSEANLFTVVGHKDNVVLYQIGNNKLKELLSLPTGRSRNNWVAFYQDKILTTNSEINAVEFDLHKIRSILEENNLNW